MNLGYNFDVPSFYAQQILYFLNVILWFHIWNWYVIYSKLDARMNISYIFCCYNWHIKFFLMIEFGEEHRFQGFKFTIEFNLAYNYFLFLLNSLLSSTLLKYIVSFYNSLLWNSWDSASRDWLMNYWIGIWINWVQRNNSNRWRCLRRL